MNTALAFVTVCAIALLGLVFYIGILVYAVARTDENSGDRWWGERGRNATRAQKAQKSN